MIPEHISANFETLCRAHIDGRLACLECRERGTNRTVYAVVAISDCEGSDEQQFIPLALMIDDNPYELLDPPNPSGGFTSDN